MKSQISKFKFPISNFSVAISKLQWAVFALIVWLVPLISVHSRAHAAEQLVLRLRDNPEVSSSIVRFNDVAEIISGSSTSLERFRELPLGPAPRDGLVQTWHRSDVQQHLELRGVHAQSVRWTGPESTRLQAVQETPVIDPASVSPAFVDQRILDNAVGIVSHAIREHLNLGSGHRTDWRVDLKLSAQQARLLQSRSTILTIRGGQEPWTGKQKFVLQTKSSGKVIEVAIEADVQLPPMVVVAKGPIRRDAILTEEMLSYAPLPPKADERNLFTEFESVVGKQVRRAVSTNQPIAEDSIGDPIVIQRNDLVEIESVAGAIVVRTPGKSHGSGAVGDLVEVEIQGRRKRLLATVVAPSKVRIAAVSVPSKSK